MVDAEYLYRFLTQKTITTYLQAVAESSTSAYPSIKPSIIEDLEIDLPPIREQKSIAHILSTLDDKIEVNNQINRTLEEMAQTIFKHWFVDFEFPNEQGKPYKSSGGEVESELGMIPKGWEVKKNSDVLKLNYGKALKSKDRQPGKYPVYGSNGIVGFHNKYLVDGPSIVVGRKGNPGTVNYVRDSFFFFQLIRRFT
ncbi:restriction endonuclease subunit S [Terrilactibacillus sp. S3-3]|nr:restriction endonuclease subunit S [Terrilactibacillus sp. S3-3]